MEPAGRSAWREYDRRRVRRPGFVILGCAAAATFSAASVALVLAGADALLRSLAGVSVPSAVGREAMVAGALAGGIVVLARALVDHDPWRVGAEGEETTASALAPLADEGWHLLHDRRLLPSRANIDHLAVGPGGVWVIETKAWSGTVVAGPDRLRRNGVNADAVYDQVWRETRAVSTALAPFGDGLEARAAICLPRATVVIGRDAAGRLALGPVEVHTPASLARRLRLAPVVLSPAQVDVVAGVIDRALPPAAGRQDAERRARAP